MRRHPPDFGAVAVDDGMGSRRMVCGVVCVNVVVLHGALSLGYPALKKLGGLAVHCATGARPPHGGCCTTAVLVESGADCEPGASIWTRRSSNDMSPDGEPITAYRHIMWLTVQGRQC